MMRCSFLFSIFLSLAAIGFLGGCKTISPQAADPSMERFNRVDINGDGVLSQDEINKSFVDTLFKSRDLNGDGKLTREEWVVGDDPAAVRTFEEHDLNKDGIVTLAEAETRGLGKDGMAANFIAGADTDRNGVVDREEAIAYYARTEGPVR